MFLFPRILGGVTGLITACLVVIGVMTFRSSSSRVC